MEYEWREAGDHGCENVAPGTLVTHSRMCLLCQARPVDECDEFGRLLTMRAPGAQRLKGGPVRCCDVWDTRFPACTAGRDRPCSVRCRCHCDKCTVGRVWPAARHLKHTYNSYSRNRHQTSTTPYLRSQLTDLSLKRRTACEQYSCTTNR